MPHLERHAESGNRFRIDLSGADAVYDQALNGNVFVLLDWGDRIMQDTSFSVRDKQVALMLYAHRHLPDLEAADPIHLSSSQLAGAVYGIVKQMDDDGNEWEELAIVQETELRKET